MNKLEWFERQFVFNISPGMMPRMTPVDLAFFDAEHDDHHLVRINEILITLTS